MKLLLPISILLFAGCSYNFQSYSDWYKDKLYSQNYKEWLLAEVKDCKYRTDGYMDLYVKEHSSGKLRYVVQKPALNTKECIQNGFTVVVPKEL